MPNGNQPMTFPEAIISLLSDTRDALVRIVERRWGAVRAYIEDVRDNVRFEDSRVDLITFICRVNFQFGTLTPITVTQRIHPEYLFACRRVHGFFSDPSEMGVNVAFIEAQIRENGRAQDMLLTPINLAAIVPGTGHDRAEWETPYVFREAAEISVNWILRPEAVTFPWTPLPSGRDQLVGIVLVGDLIRKKILP